jgi:hypothetical protein
MTRGNDFAYASGDARVCVPPAGGTLIRDGIAVTVEHNVSPLGEKEYSVHIVGIKRAELHSLSVGFAVGQSPFLKLNHGDQELFAIVGRDDLSVTVEPSKSTRP